MSPVRQPNSALRRHMSEARWNGPALAAALHRVAGENNLRVGYDRTTVAHWLSGTQPRPPAPRLLEEAFSRRLGRPVCAAELGLPPEGAGPGRAAPADDGDPVAALHRLYVGTPASGPGGETLRPALYQLRELPAPRSGAPAAVLPQAGPSRRAPLPPADRFGPCQADAVHELAAFGARYYDAHGGANARALLLAGLREQALPWLRTAAGRPWREELLVASARLTRLIARTYADDLQQGEAQRHYRLAHQLAAAAGHGPAQAMALRDESAQANALGHHEYAARLAALAAAHLQGSSPPGVRAFVLAQQAVAAAHLHRRDEALRVLDRAQHLTARSAAEGGPEQYPESALLFQMAQTHRALGAADSALSLLRASLRTRPAEEHRALGLSLLLLADLELDTGDVHRARQAYDLYRTRYHGVRSGVTEARRLRLRTRFERLSAHRGQHAEPRA